MTKNTVPAGLRPSGDRRLDVVAFFGAFVTGLILDAALTFIGAPKGLVITAVIAVMGSYALAAARIPRLRVRLDQAGDNAYYLGLLFTLVSMAVALHQFGLTEFGAANARDVGARKIIGDFGLALGTTIAGIFLRVLLHQMRIDPSDLEEVSRLELTEAANRVKVTLNGVAAAMVRFQDELKQRTLDQLGQTVADVQTALGTLTREVSQASTALMRVTSAAHQEAIKLGTAINAGLKRVAAESDATVAHFGSARTSLETVVGQLGGVSTGLGDLKQGVGDVTSHLRTVGAAAEQMNTALSRGAATLSASTAASAHAQGQAIKGVEDAGRRLKDVLATVGQALEEDRKRLAVLEDQTHQSAHAALQAQEDVQGVLRSLVEMTKALTETVNSVQ